MNKTAIIIPSRLNAQRLPNKPLKIINNKPMILHVYDAAKKSNAGEVFVASPDQKILDVVKNYGGKVIKTSQKHETGTDRVHEAFKDYLNYDMKIIVNLQGDMPNINPKAIKDLIVYMEKGNCDIGTLASEFKSGSEIEDPNIVKVLVKEKMRVGMFSEAQDFIRVKTNTKYIPYHHIGIYAFTNKALIRYVSLKRSKLELERKLEQLRAMESNMSIHVGYINTIPLSVDTKKDLAAIKKIMEKNA